MEYTFTVYNGTGQHSSIVYLPPDEFEMRWNESADFRKKFLEEMKKKGEKILKKRPHWKQKKCPKLRGLRSF